MAPDDLTTLIQWLTGQGPWAVRSAFSLWLPTCVLVWALIVHRKAWTRQMWAFVLGGALLGTLYGSWVETPDQLSLFLPPFFVAVSVGAFYKRQFFTPSVVFGGCFLSLLIPDLLKSASKFGLENPTWLWGIGGAGIQDGLLMFPLLCVLLQLYARLRHQAESAK